VHSETGNIQTIYLDVVDLSVAMSRGAAAEVQGVRSIHRPGAHPLRHEQDCLCRLGRGGPTC